ncbi:MAG: phosphatidylglycerophosphatase A [Candidatus Eisenbacteria bacterium]|nr:phosphatidylglycerophosphatase A [Candidatus Eisenbacteria bacterium]
MASIGPWAARSVATFGFVGQIPGAPGTYASAIVLAAWLLIPPIPIWIALVIWGLIVLAGVWAAGLMESRLGHDDGRVVIDEVAGALLTVAGFAATPWIAIAGFVLFRALDILKPPPIYQLQALPGGIGVMADDIAAGLAGNILLRLLTALIPAIASAFPGGW